MRDISLNVFQFVPFSTEIHTQVVQRTFHARNTNDQVPLKLVLFPSGRQKYYISYSDALSCCWKAFGMYKNNLYGDKNKNVMRFYDVSVYTFRMSKEYATIF